MEAITRRLAGDGEGSPDLLPAVEQRVLAGWRAALWVISAATAFQVAYECPRLCFLMAVFLWCLFPLARLATARQAFYSGLVLGLMLYAPQLAFFWKIFGVLAISFWTILSLAPGLFVLLARASARRFPPVTATLLVPFLWTGLEYLRGELTYLRFTWLAPGFAFSQSPVLDYTGVYGITFLLLLAIALLRLLPRRVGLPAGLVGLAVLLLVTAQRPGAASPPTDSGPFVVGIQLEAASERYIVEHLDIALATYPEADLFVLSEYSFGSPIPEAVRAWCGRHHRYLIAGGMDPETPDGAVFRNTGFVVGPAGEVVFQQGKTVPIQFFSDGLPARDQRVWASPWGKIGICICYDLSYARVTDVLIREGAGALIVPTMDVMTWGSHEHLLHGRIAPTRAAEYHVPIFRVCSSGISQLVQADGTVAASAPFPGQGAMIAGRLALSKRTRIPMDRMLAPACVAIAAGAAIFLAIDSRRR